jgi:hypothetical protein
MKTISIRVFLFLMFVTGLVQIDILNLQWEYLTTIRALHVFGSILISVVLIIPFANTHSYEVLFIKKRDNMDGFILGFILFVVILSGFYLFFIGNRGGDIVGEFAFYSHLFGSLFLVGSLNYHIFKVKAQKRLFGTIVSIFLVFSFLLPLKLYSSDMVSIKLENGLKRYHSEDWTNSTKCKSCHKDIFDQWADSNHKNIAGANPYYMVLESLSAVDMGEDFRQWCMGCHNPSAVTTKQRATSHGMNGNFLANEIFEKNAKTLQDNFKKEGNFMLEEGVSCVACHRITDASSKGNSSYQINLTQRKKYSLEDNQFPIGRWIGEKFINSKPNIHKQSYSNKLYKDGKYCASCHNESLPNHKNISKNAVGKEIVSTYDEWKKSPYNDPKNPTKHKTCIDCHMTNLSDGKFVPLKGTSTDGGKIKKDIKVHYFSGSNHFLSGLKNKEHEKQTIDLLKTSAKLDMSFKNKQLKIGVTNIGAGHHLPTGVADFRELWLEIEIKDKNGNIIFESGKLNENGDLEQEARVFKKVFGDKDGKPVGLLFWRYEKLISDTRIPAKQRRVETYDLQHIEIKYPISIKAKLNFRIYPQWVTNIVQKAYPVLPNPPVIELNNIQSDFAR